MTARVLVATDLSDASDEALRQGHAYAKAAGATLGICHVLSIAPPVDLLFPQKYQEAALAIASLEAAARAAAAERVAAVAGNTPVEIFVEQGTDYVEVIRRAEAWKADVIVVGSHGRTGLPRLLLGSVAERVVRYAHSPVMVARPMAARSGVLVATDLSDPSLPAVAAGAEEARRRGVHLTVMHALDFGAVALSVITTPFGISPYVPSVEIQEEVRKATAERLKQSVDSLGATGDTLVVIGDAATSIVSTADQINAELLVVGTHGRTGLSRIALGSVAERVLRVAACSVLAVRLTGT